MRTGKLFILACILPIVIGGWSTLSKFNEQKEQLSQTTILLSRAVEVFRLSKSNQQLKESALVIDSAFIIITQIIDSFPYSTFAPSKEIGQRERTLTNISKEIEESLSSASLEVPLMINYYSTTQYLTRG
jgi:hypothetical protein